MLFGAHVKIPHQVTVEEKPRIPTPTPSYL